MNIEDQKLLDLLEKDWEYNLEVVPEMATVFGDHSHDHRLSDISPEAFESKYKHNLDLLDKLKSIDFSNLSEENQLNYRLYVEKLETEIGEYQFKGYLMPLNQMVGIQHDLPHIVMMMPFKTEKDYRNYLSRINALPEYVDQLINLLNTGIKENYTIARAAIVNVPDQIGGQIPENYHKSVYYKALDYKNNVSGELKNQIELAIKEVLYPAFQKLKQYLEDIYIPAARESLGLSDLPDGKDYYNLKLKAMTTTDLTAEQIHEIGVREVERIYQEAVKISHEVGFKSDYNAFLENLKINPDFYFTEAEDLMISYRDICKRADKELPKLFKVLPRLPYGVEEIPDHQAPSYPTAYYMPSDINMTRAGIFYANTYQLETRPKYEMEALALHEAVPGHHLQIALSFELDNLPKFRRMSMSDFTGYIEGWGLYSEKLGEEMGFYKDPYAKFGQLSFEMWRACRLVIDTGLHAFGWSRQKAIDYLKHYTGKSEAACAVEVDRYVSIPGQATAYKIGELKILELRRIFEEKKGDDFDVREFHDLVLKNGALPLDVLEKYVMEHLNA